MMPPPLLLFPLHPLPPPLPLMWPTIWPVIVPTISFFPSLYKFSPLNIFLPTLYIIIITFKILLSTKKPPKKKKMALGLEITELRLGLPGHLDSINHPAAAADRNEKKRVFSEMSGGGSAAVMGDRKVQNNNQVVGWPPVCSYRRKNSFKDKVDRAEATKMYVKVSMDGAPFLRKIDLSSHQDYSDLVAAFEKLFGCFGIGK